MESNNIHENMNLIARILNQAKPKFQNGDNSPYWNQLSQQTKAYWQHQNLDLQWMLKHSKEIAIVANDLTYVQNNCVDGDYVNVLVMSTETGQFEALIHRDENTDKDCYEDSVLFTQGSLQHIGTINKLFKHLEKHIENYMIIVVDLLHCKDKKPDNSKYTVMWQFEKAKRLRYEHCLQLKYAKLCSEAMSLINVSNLTESDCKDASMFYTLLNVAYDHMHEKLLSINMINDYTLIACKQHKYEFDRGRLYIDFNYTIHCNGQKHRYCSLMPYNIERNFDVKVQFVHNLILCIREYVTTFSSVFKDSNVKTQLANYATNGFDDWCLRKIDHLTWQNVLK